MASDALSSRDSVYGSDQHASHAPHIDDFWLALVGSVDALLRSLHGIHEFTEDPECVLRIALGRTRSPLTLSDGAHLVAGVPIGALHLWNEHLPRYSERGPDVAWACEIRRRVLHSMRLLAAYIEREPVWRPVRAFCAATTLSNRLGELQIRRLAARHGFERVDPPPSVLGKLHALGDCFNTWALTRAFNPIALSRQPFLRGRNELWISRSVLLDRYGAARKSAEVRAERVT